jgi:hypothetical protein
MHSFAYLSQFPFIPHVPNNIKKARKKTLHAPPMHNNQFKEKKKQNASYAAGIIYRNLP